MIYTKATVEQLQKQKFAPLSQTGMEEKFNN